MEAERAMLKLLRGLDKHLQHVRQAAAKCTPPADSPSQLPTAEPSAVSGAQTMSAAGKAAHSNNSMFGLPPRQPSQQSDVSLTPAVTDMWNNPIAELASDAVHSQQQLAQQGGEYSISGNPDRRPQFDISLQRSLLRAEASSPSSQAVSRGASVDQEPHQAAVAQSPRLSTDEPTRPFNGDARGIPGHARSALGDARSQRRVTSDLQQPLAGDTPPPADRPMSFRSSSRKEKLEYRLSQDDVYSPTVEEVQALLQQGLLKSQQQQQQLSSYGGGAASDVASNMQSSFNGMWDAGGSAAVSAFANPSVIAGLPGSQAKVYLQQEEPHMLSLIAKVQSVQVRLHLWSSLDVCDDANTCPILAFEPQSLSVPQSAMHWLSIASWLSACPSVCLSVCLSVRESVCQCQFLSVCSSVCGYACAYVLQAEADSIDLGSCAEAEQVQASLQVGTNARQLIMEDVIQLQVSVCITITVLFFVKVA